MPLQSNGTCTYNDVSFTMLYHSKVSAKPLYDEANRTNTFVEHTLEIDGFLAVQSTDTTLADMRKKLTKPGAILRYKNKGYGELTVNDLGVYDGAWGPIPEILEWEPIGGENACHIRWKVTTKIPECDNAIYKQGLAAVNYDVDYTHDQDGYTTIKISGYLEIPLTRSQALARDVQDNADNYREKIRPDIPLGFQRKTQDFKLSKDRRRLDFTFVDEEIPEPLPDKVTHIEAKQRISGGLTKGVAKGFRIWGISLDVTVTLARGQGKKYAWTVFLLIFRSRLAGLKLFPQELDVEDDIYGRSTSFHWSGRATRESGYTIKQILEESNLWTAISGTNWQKWRSSIENTAGNVRGTAQTKYDEGRDAIIDLCMGDAPGGAAAGDVNPPNNNGAGPDAGDPLRGKGGGKAIEGSDFRDAPNFSFDEAPAGNVKGVQESDSWIGYTCEVHYLEQSNVVRHKPLPIPGTLPPINAGTSNGGMDVSTAINETVGNVAAQGYTGAPRDVYQQPVAPTRMVVMSGVAMRAKWQIPAPELVSVGGVPAVEMSRSVREIMPFGSAGTPIYATAWSITYALEGPPTGALPTLPDPASKVDGKG